MSAIRESLESGKVSEDEAARKTYRYVRLGMIAAVLLLGASLFIEWRNAPANCTQASISAYYYTPVHAVFVGVLVSVGLCLIVIKGSSPFEDLCLNFAGILAPVVALVPTSNPGSCWSTPVIDPAKNPEGAREFAEWVGASITNNVDALLIAGFAGLVAAAVIAIAAIVARPANAPGLLTKETLWPHRSALIGLGLVAALLIATALVRRHGWFLDTAHYIAAISMFAFLALAAAANGWDAWRVGGRHKPYSKLYWATSALMVLTGVLFFSGWKNKVFVIEALEITWFILLWGVQTRELWNNTLRQVAPLPK